MKIKMECVDCGVVHKGVIRQCGSCGSTNVVQLQLQQGREGKWHKNRNKKK